MKKHFYSHIVETESLVIALSDLNLSEQEKVHLIGIIDSSLQHAILDAVLSELSEKDKKEFLDQMSSEDNEKIWKFLNGKVENIEEKIKKVAKDLKEELHKDIKSVREK
ncbi:MAG TPA: hypothetical protein VF189_03205 [Patescibacteria group bacterium]